MTDLVYDFISTGVDMILMAAILSSIVVLLRSSVILSNYQSNLASNSDRMNYYKQYNMYDCTDNLCSADVMSALIYYRYDLEMVVWDTNTGALVVKNDPSTGKFTNAAGNEVTVSNLGSILDSRWKYNTYLCEDGSSSHNTSNYAGGVVTGIWFGKHYP